MPGGTGGTGGTGGSDVIAPCTHSATDHRRMSAASGRLVISEALDVLRKSGRKLSGNHDGATVGAVDVVNRLE